MTQLKGNAVIAQGGGPTAVINQSLVGAVLEAQRFSCIEKMYGARHGVRGIIDEDFVDLTSTTPANLEQVALTPSSALLSTRDKPDEEYCAKIFEVLKAHNVRFFFYIGGNDSADTCRIVSENAENAGYDLCVVHIPKTIDNDLRVTDHCPGYGSAAKFVAHAFTGVNLDNRSIPGVYIGVVMGRHAGFLTAASALARKYEDDGPHCIYLPEKPFDNDRFIAHVDEAYKKYGRCVIAVSEGIANEKGDAIITTLTNDNERDAHGNVQLSGTGALADALSGLIKEKLKIKRVRGDTFGYLQRSFAGIVSETDAREAREVGQKAVQFTAIDNRSGSVAIQRCGDYAVEYILTPLHTVARHTKPMPDDFIDADNADVTPAFMEYVRPLAGSLPVQEHLVAPAVEKILSA